MNLSRILYLATDLFAKGGIQRYSRSQIQALRELLSEDQVTVFSVNSPQQNQFEEPFTTHYIGQGTSTQARLRFSVRTLLRGLSEKPDIVWSNHISLLPLAKMVNRVCGGSSTVLNVYGLEMWSGLRGYEEWALLRATRIISDCHFTANYVQEAFSIPVERLAIIWDPVDENRFVPSDDIAAQVLPRYGVPYQPQVCYLMTLGRISEASRHKGYDRMLDVMKQIERTDLVFLLVGDGDDRARLERRVANEGLSGRVFFLGSVPESDLVNVYNAADVFVLVSDRGHGRGEGVPLTPLEAAACGKPIIVGDEDGSPEAVIQGENGYIVSPRDLDAIRQAVLRLVDDPDLRTRMGRAARQRVEQDFSYTAFKCRTGDVLERLVASGGQL